MHAKKFSLLILLLILALSFPAAAQEDIELDFWTWKIFHVPGLEAVAAKRPHRRSASVLPRVVHGRFARVVPSAPVRTQGEEVPLAHRWHSEVQHRSECPHHFRFTESLSTAKSNISQESRIDT